MAGKLTVTELRTGFTPGRSPRCFARFTFSDGRIFYCFSVGRWLRKDSAAELELREAKGDTQPLLAEYRTRALHGLLRILEIRRGFNEAEFADYWKAILDHVKVMKYGHVESLIPGGRGHVTSEVRDFILGTEGDLETMKKNYL